MSDTSPPRPPLKARLISLAGGTLLTSLLGTTRCERVGTGSFAHGRTVLYVLWHGRLLPTAYWHRHRGLATLISQHRDGDYISGVVEGWGYRVVRGSSSRGGTAALLQLVRLLQEGVSVAVTPDGPRGPRQKMKLGPLRAAQLAGVPLVPVTSGTDRAWWVESWDRFLVPKPFSRIRLAYGEPFTVPPEATEPELEELARELGARLDRLTEEVDAGS